MFPLVVKLSFVGITTSIANRTNVKNIIIILILKGNVEICFCVSYPLQHALS